MSFTIQFKDLPVQARTNFMNVWSDCPDIFTNEIGEDIFKKLTGISIQYREGPRQSFLDDKLTFNNEYEYTLFLLSL